MIQFHFFYLVYLDEKLSHSVHSTWRKKAKISIESLLKYC